MFTSVLFILYALIILGAVVWITRKSIPCLSSTQISFYFIIKILFGISYGVIFLKFYNGDDTWLFHEMAVQEYNVILENPVHYIENLIKEPVTADKGNFLGNHNSYWNNLESDLFRRLLVIFNFFSLGNYYINNLLFCAITFIAHLLLFRLFTRHFPDASFLLTIFIFLFPVVLFWLSGTRKDGLLFLGVALCLYYFDRLLNKATIKHLALFTGGLLLVWLFRNIMLICLLPGLVAWLICKRYPYINPWISYLVLYGSFVICFFLSGKVNGLPDLPLRITQHQYDFMALKGNTRLPLDSLKPTPGAFLQVLPQAVNHSFLRPYLTEAKSPLHLASAMDNILFFGSLLLAIIFPVRLIKETIQHPLMLTCLFSALTGYIFIGYIVPFPGAIVRYKVVFELLFLCSFACMTDYKKIRHLLWPAKTLI